jgi:hypothetical protein
VSHRLKGQKHRRCNIVRLRRPAPSLPKGRYKNLKVNWKGTLKGVQPRIRLWRSFDERSHAYLGYVLSVDGEVDGVSREFKVAIGKGAQAHHNFQVGDRVEGASEPVPDARLETAEFYKTNLLRIVERPSKPVNEPPPWHEPLPDLETYRERGHRRLAARTYESKCHNCLWACRMPVEMIIDHWNPSQKKYRFETFCYGPKSCSFYSSGPTRKVPGRRGMIWEEEDWIDEEATSHRSMDE